MELALVDCKFMGEPGVIACYALRGPRGVALIETGPGSTAPNLVAGLESLGIALTEVSDILVTHIHLDHAGAAGWLARQTGATVHVHYIGAPHLVDPARLLASAARIYGELMDVLWGETLSAPQRQVRALRDGDVIEAAGLRIQAIDTPGHAYHHMAYVVDGHCFTGDVAAVRLAGQQHVRVPTPPPEIDIPLWQRSLRRLRAISPDQLLPTHFGPVAGEAAAHLQVVEESLLATEAFVRERWQNDVPTDELTTAYRDWVAARAARDGADPTWRHRYEVIVPSDMCVAGMLRALRQSGTA